jgi:hypothetical protein
MHVCSLYYQDQNVTSHCQNQSALATVVNQIYTCIHSPQELGNQNCKGLLDKGTYMSK